MLASNLYFELSIGGQKMHTRTDGLRIPSRPSFGQQREVDYFIVFLWELKHEILDLNFQPLIPSLALPNKLEE
jgi:hypothetical protein